MGAVTNLNVLEFHGCSLLPDIQVFCFGPLYSELLCYIIYWGLGHGWLEWSLLRYILIWLWFEKGVCCLTVTALRDRGSKYIIA